MLCIVSCFKKYFMATQLSFLNLDSFIFQLRQWALESQGASGYLKTLIFGPETSKLRLKYLSRVFFSKQEEPKDGQRQVWQENGFPLIQKLTFCLSELHLWYPAQTAVFFICLEINMTSYVKNYFWSKYYLLSEFGRSWNVLKNVSQSFFRLFLNLFFSHDGCKTVTAMCVCGEFPWKLENNQLSDCSIIFFFLCPMEILMNFSRICAQSSVLKVSFCRSEFGLPGLKVTDFGRNGQDLVLVFVNILRFLL